MYNRLTHNVFKGRPSDIQSDEFLLSGNLQVVHNRRWIRLLPFASTAIALLLLGGLLIIGSLKISDTPFATPWTFKNESVIDLTKLALWDSNGWRSKDRSSLNIIFNSHSHSLYSDGDMTVEQVNLSQLSYINRLTLFPGHCLA